MTHSATVQIKNIVTFTIHAHSKCLYACPILSGLYVSLFEKKKYVYILMISTPNHATIS